MSYWHTATREHILSNYKNDKPVEQYDVCIIGAGITGTSTAFHLLSQSPNLKVIVIEARTLCGGATGRNGGHLWPGMEKALETAIEEFGIERTSQAYKFEAENVAALLKFIEEYNVDCDLQMFGSLYVVEHEEELEELYEEFELLKQNNLHDVLKVEIFDAERVAKVTNSKRFAGGHFTGVAGSLHPSKLVHAIAEQAIKLGLHLYTHTRVTSVEPINDMHCIKAESDQTFYAKHVVYANNAWIGQILPFAKDLVVPTRGQVITTKPLPNYWKTGLLFNDGYDYMIQRKDGRVVLGGGRLESETEEQPELDDSTIHPSISKVLRSFLNSYLDVKEPVEIEEEWTGIMGFSPDELPLVGPVPGMKNQYMAAGFTGHGMPVTFLSAKALADMILGKEVFLPEIYNPQRFVPK